VEHFLGKEEVTGSIPVVGLATPRAAQVAAYTRPDTREPQQHRADITSSLINNMSASL
jgi:hypothetical protein